MPISVGSGCERFWTHCTLEKVRSHVFISTFDLPSMSIPAAPILRPLATERTTTIFLIAFVCFNPLSPKIDFYVDILICATSWASNHKFMLLSKIFQETYYL